MPLRSFWVMSAQINRVSAERELRDLNILIGSQSKEGIEDTRDRLLKEMGQVTTGTEPHWERDEEGFEDLKHLASML